MFRAVGYTLLFLAMFMIAGGHWAVLQSVAWTGMIIEYSKNSSISSAVYKTFGGKAACDMCKTIEAGKQKESRLPSGVKCDKKIEKFVVRSGRVVPRVPETIFSYPPVFDEVAFALPSSPPAPVPIAA